MDVISAAKLRTQKYNNKDNKYDFKNYENELKIRCYSSETIKNYIFINKKLLEFNNKSPRDITGRDIKDYMLHIIENFGAKPATINLTICAFKSYYVDFLKRRFLNDIKRAKSEQKEPNVLTKNEINLMIEKTQNPKHKLLIELLYSSGLRVSEGVKLKIEDVYFEDNIIIIKQGKGRKDRYVITSKRFINDLTIFLEKRIDNNPYVFPSAAEPDKHITIRTAQKVVKSAAKLAGIKRRVCCHALRASFATHLYQDGTDIFNIQKLLGHSRTDTTKIYTKTNFNMLNTVTSPLE